jgi:hypothetical protein
MIRDTPLLLVSVILILGAAPSATAADDAVDADGRATPGVFALDDAGRPHFVPKGQMQPLPLKAIAYIRFSDVASEPFRAGFIRRVLLPDGQRITGRLQDAKGDALAVQTVWAGRLDVPRSAAVALRQPAGLQSVFEDDFADGLQEWNVSGKPVVDGDSPAAALSAGGQALTYGPSEPPDAGRVAVNFRDRDAAGARWSLELRFQGDSEPRTMRVTFAGPGDGYGVRMEGLEGETRRVARSPGWHRLTVRFSPDSLSVLCDDAVLWSNLHQGPAGTLRLVSLLCDGETKSDAVRGLVDFTDFSLSRAVDEPRRPAGDPTQEEIWLADGDQLFGDALHIDRRTVGIEGAFGKRSLPWADVRGCWFRHDAERQLRALTQPGSPSSQPGSPSSQPNSSKLRVRLWIDSGFDPEPDSLDGVLQGIDDKQATLQHPALGELHIRRDRLRQLRFLPD